MDLWQKLKQIFGKKAPAEAIESRFKSDQTIESINQSSINQSISQIPQEGRTRELFVDTQKPSQSIELQKDSLHLGLAAGYTGRALKEIESALMRIESSMVTRDWFSNQFEDQTPEIIEAIKKHDENMQKQFEEIEKTIGLMYKTAEKTPEPLKTELFEQIKAVESRLPLTPKMRQLVTIVKEIGEISYSELSKRLSITEDALRGLLSTTMGRTDSIIRFKKGGRGWVKYIQNIQTSDSITNQSDQSIV